MQTIKLEHGFDSEGYKFKDGVQDDRQIYLTSKLDIKHFNFDFNGCLEA